jgi:Ca2+-binding EF-hand superfamily protein
LRACSRRMSSSKASLSDVTRRKAQKALRLGAMEFESFDLDSDGYLSRDDFYDMMRHRTGKANMDVEVMDTWFEVLVETDAARLSLDDFFKFKVLEVSQGLGGIKKIFQAYDTDGSGKLSAPEFAEAMEDLGFGGVAAALMAQFDHDNDGTIGWVAHISRSACCMHRSPPPAPLRGR